MPNVVFTLGHSTHAIERFCALLAEHDVRALADVRRFPGSRTFPQFNRESLADTLAAAGIEYRWMESLGGRRSVKSQQPSPNVGLRNASFRNYADYMATAEFRRALDELVRLAQEKPTAYMCSEGLYWRCHRRLISDVLSTRGWTIRHIMPDGKLRPHELTAGVVLENGELVYCPVDENPDQRRLPFDR
jgi:uncharacterized protein (DUF488 family)